ncbi:MAG: hypothetical protein PF541_13120 [Prolixibacteraceae bacterium]|jgi:hypothetical protein|nr:hypothetical protein [Prolixibacteraceae bacterium]
MNQLLIAILIGLIAGTIDALPMLIQKMDRMACISAFGHYLVLGLIIPFIHWEISGWLTGVIVSVLSSIPVMTMVIPKEKKAFLPMLFSAILLGAAIGWAGAKFIS